MPAHRVLAAEERKGLERDEPGQIPPEDAAQRNQREPGRRLWIQIPACTISAGRTACQPCPTGSGAHSWQWAPRRFPLDGLPLTLALRCSTVCLEPATKSELGGRQLGAEGNDHAGNLAEVLMLPIGDLPPFVRAARFVERRLNDLGHAARAGAGGSGDWPSFQLRNELRVRREAFDRVELPRQTDSLPWRSTPPKSHWVRCRYLEFVAFGHPRDPTHRRKSIAIKYPRQDSDLRPTV